ncbi:GDP-mannose mannosyl hydrolase [Chromobacterium sp. S0633]|uniref:GDP-mannose mannosyl hydrolase n=1 Tax=Chromobacterium sp. S0633 TaxID=2957805 RepID=UPI0020A0AC95|nr:GDP-mannose mannosyl hydrolase [Chromobacterium sp. S0633]MCP1289057.1 GDP-mannose mannosyl hydrolase [Chromobacterium sp. S0633]
MVAANLTSHESSFLPVCDFMQIVKFAPLISIDFIIENNNGNLLLGLRKNQPAAGFWFVPGGRVRKNESLDNAFYRLFQEELGFSFNRSDAEAFGVWEHFYGTNAYCGDEFSTHYIVLAYKIKFSTSFGLERLPYSQHTQYKWATASDICTDPSVHKNTQAYFS